MFDVHHGKKRESVMTTNVNIVENFGTTLHTPLAVERKDFFPPSQFFPPLMNFSHSRKKREKALCQQMSTMNWYYSTYPPSR
jgi:hypothetical protein